MKRLRVMIQAGSPFAAPVKTIRPRVSVHLLRVLPAIHLVAGIRLTKFSLPGFKVPRTGARPEMFYIL
jgi:hypothetical protein